MGDAQIITVLSFQTERGIFGVDRREAEDFSSLRSLEITIL